MLIALTIAILFGAFVFHSSKRYSIIMMIYMWILFAFNTMNGDYIPYSKIYVHIINNNSEVINTYEEGFVFLCKIGGKLGLSYQQFLIIPATVTIVLFYVVIRLYCSDGYQNVLIALFIIFSYWMMICQYRTYIGILLALIGLYFLYRFDGIRGIIPFIIFVLLGTLFHRMIFLYIILLPAKRWKTKSIVILIPIVAALVLLARNPALSNIIARYVPAYKMTRWLYTDGTRSLAGTLALLVLRLGLIFFEVIMSYHDDKYSTDETYNSKQHFIIKVSLLCLAFLPLEFSIKDFERLSRIPLFLLFVFILNYVKERKVNIHKVPLTVISVSGFLALYMVMYYISFSGWFVHNLIPVLTQNSLFG